MAEPTGAFTADDVLRWDVAGWRPALEYWERTMADRSCGAALEIGAREGGLALWLSRRCDQVVCSDIWGIDRAREAHEPFGLDNVRYEEFRATDIPYREAFDVIGFKSVIGAVGGAGAGLADQRLAFEEIHAALKPGGVLLFAENLVATPMHQYLRRRFNPWSANWRYVSLKELRDMLRPFRDFELHTTGFLGALGRSERQHATLAAADQAILNRITPTAWKYVAYGSAVK